MTHSHTFIIMINRNVPLRADRCYRCDLVTMCEPTGGGFYSLSNFFKPSGNEMQNKSSLKGVKHI